MMSKPLARSLSRSRRGAGARAIWLPVCAKITSSLLPHFGGLPTGLPMRRATWQSLYQAREPENSSPSAGLFFKSMGSFFSWWTKTMQASGNIS
jgi:hypothetical protein